MNSQWAHEQRNRYLRDVEKDFNLLSQSVITHYRITGKLPTEDSWEYDLTTTLPGMPGPTLRYVPKDLLGKPYIFRRIDNGSGRDFEIICAGFDGRLGSADDIVKSYSVK